MSNTIMTMIRRVVVSILFSHYRTVSLQRFVHSQPASAFYPIIGQMERAAGLAHDDTPQAKLDKLDSLLAQSDIQAGGGAVC
jgi:hypothetical protein